VRTYGGGEHGALSAEEVQRRVVEAAAARRGF
jgi:hypothetical protein